MRLGPPTRAARRSSRAMFASTAMPRPRHWLVALALVMLLTLLRRALFFL